MFGRWLARRRLRNPAYGFLFEPAPPGEAVAIDCETTGLDRRADDIVSIAAVRVRGTTVETSTAFRATVRSATPVREEAIKVHGITQRDVSMGRAMADTLPALLHFIGARPLIGYYLEFDVAMLDRYVRPWLGIGLPNSRIEVSRLYYDRKYGYAPPGVQFDLSFAAIAGDLGLTIIDRHDAFADATITALMYLKLKDLQQRGAHLSRRPSMHDGLGA